MEACLPDKPEVLAMCAITGMDPDTIVGKCFRVWRWFDQHTREGNANGVTLVTLAYAIGNGEGSLKFLQAMKTVGWVVEDETGVSLPNFDRHNGETAKTRALTAKRVAKHKAKSNAEGNDSGNAISVSDALPREEKRREEVNTDNDSQTSDLFSPKNPKPKKAPAKTTIPADFTASDSTIKWAAEKGIGFIPERIEHFKSVAVAKGYTYADWQQAFKNACRDDWAKLNGKAASAPERKGRFLSIDIPGCL